MCALATENGDCTEKLARWAFVASENRCAPFYHSGCGGNGNTFATKETCEADCPKRVGKSDRQTDRQTDTQALRRSTER